MSIVIPVHDESGNIRGLIQEIEALPLEQAYEIVVVDDASRDRTRDVLRELTGQVDSLVVLEHKQNYGQSAALATGIAAARGSIVATLDGDGQNDPADIPRLLACLRESSNSRLRMVAGFRKKRKDSTWRILSSRIANSVRAFFLRDETPDTGCGLKVFFRSTFLELPFFDHMHRFLPALVRMRGGDVESVEVSHRPRAQGRSHYGTLGRLRVGIVDLFGVAWLRRRAKNVEAVRWE